MNWQEEVVIYTHHPLGSAEEQINVRKLAADAISVTQGPGEPDKKHDSDDQIDVQEDGFERILRYTPAPPRAAEDGWHYGTPPDPTEKLEPGPRCCFNVYTLDIDTRLTNGLRPFP